MDHDHSRNHQCAPDRHGGRRCHRRAIRLAWQGLGQSNTPEGPSSLRTQMQTLLEELRTRSGKELFVHRLQFEKEFEVYLHLWKEVLAMGRAASRFRAVGFGSGVPVEEDLRDLRAAHNQLKDRVCDYRPFYAPRVYELTEETLGNARWVHRIEAGSARAVQRTEEVERNLDKINDAVDAICDAIRERVFPRRVWYDRNPGNDPRRKGVAGLAALDLPYEGHEECRATGGGVRMVRRISSRS